VAVVGAGRLGTALAHALRERGHDVRGPLGRGEPAEVDAALLCVPDAEIEAAAVQVAGSARFVGHTSGATPLSALARAGAESFGLHPLQTFAHGSGSFEGAACAVAGSTPDALALAERLAGDLGMEPFEIADEDRPAYHAAASIASNFLVTLEAAAESLGMPRHRLAPLVRQTVENWERLGAEQALTGPVARGDELTVERQRAAVEAERPELLPLWDALVELTRDLARVAA
jgi:predicted short-subunit dehydrogenase-like oxidoreductase (DUF2520 family)